MSMEAGMESVSMWRRPMEALSSDGVKELHRLQAENAKLRELVHDMFGAYERIVCLLPDSYLKNVSKRGAMDFRERIQELESKAIK